MSIRTLIFLLFITHIAFSQITVQGYRMEKDGDTFFQVIINIDTGYHIYGIDKVEGPTPTEIKLDENKTFSYLQVPKGIEHFDEGFGLPVVWYSGRDTFLIQVEGTYKGRLGLQYQICTKTYCFPPKVKQVFVSEKLFSLRQVVKKKDVSEKKIKKKTLKEGSSIVLFFLASLGAGLLSLMTPCVFPMIPITVSFFTKNKVGTRKEAVKQGVLYGVGIILIFTLLGFFISYFFGAVGVQNFAANPFVNITIALVFFIFALSLFGLFDISLPQNLVNRVNQMGMKPGSFGIVIAGIAFALVSFTCTAPFFGSLLVAASLGEWFYPLVGMCGFSMSFAFPFVLLAIFPQWIAQMPKSGGWLHATKIVMAFVELAAAFKFLSQADLVWDLELLTRPLMLIIWAVLFAVSGLYLLGFFQFSKEDNVSKIGVIRLFFALFFLTSAVYFASGISGRRLQGDLDSYLPPTDYGQEEVVLLRENISKEKGTKEKGWVENYKEALALAKKENKLMFIDFTGKTCTNCRWMEKNIFHKKAIKKELDKMVKVRLWTDFGESKEENQKMQQVRFQTVALPFYAIISPQDEVLATFGGMTRDEKVFENFLKSVTNM